MPEEAFRRYDETPDEEFYLLPRFVTHIDDHAIAAVTQLYTAGCTVIDPCVSVCCMILAGKSCASVDEPVR